MTCEITVMNRHGIALAADSAVTVTRMNDQGAEEKRYFKSVNKLFQLSAFKPIGMMVYGSGDMQQVPWEILAKEYRKHLGEKSFNKVEEYGKDLLTFLQNFTEIFPRTYQEDLFVNYSEIAAIRSFLAATRSNDYLAATDKLAYMNGLLDQAIISYNSKEFFCESLNQEDLDEALGIFKEKLSQKIDATLRDLETIHEEQYPVDCKKLAEFGILAIYKEMLGISSSGVVIAGYGDQDFFPAYYNFYCYGNILGKIIYKIEEGRSISYDTHSDISAFAQTEMVETFRFGISSQAYEDASNGCKDAIMNTLNELGVDLRNVGGIIEKELVNFRNQLINKCAEKNYKPLTNVVASLPIDDMASLAETLVSLESLKEKVTQPSESVGGPIDVAVITKGDGMVWIKRKHYFPPELNPRYFQRQEKRVQ